MTTDLSNLEQRAREVTSSLRKQERHHEAALSSLRAARKSIERSLAHARRVAVSGDQQGLSQEVHLLIESAQLVVSAIASPVKQKQPAVRKPKTASQAPLVSLPEATINNQRGLAVKSKTIGVKPQTMTILSFALSAEKLNRDLLDVARGAFEPRGGLDCLIPVLAGPGKSSTMTVGAELDRGDKSQLRTSIGNTIVKVRRFRAGEFNSPDFNVRPEIVQLADLLGTKSARQVDAMLKAWGVQIS